MTTQITTEGNLTHDPELRFTQSGRAVTDVSVAVNDRVKNDEGEYVDAGSAFYKAVVWGSEAENVAQSLAKGDRVVVIGRLVTQQWTDNDDNTRSTRVIEGATVAPSLRFATVTIAKATRGNDTDPQSGEEEPPF